MVNSTCQQCGIDSHANICWLCEIENESGYIYFKTDSGGKIILWGSDNESGDFSMKVGAKDFCKLVREQYPRGGE
jgi:hypothetical protein